MFAPGGRGEEVLEINELAEMVRELLAEYIVSIEVGKDLVHVEVNVEHVKEAARRLKEKGFDHAKDVTAIDYPKQGIIKIFYHLSSYNNKDLSKYVLGLGYSIPRNRDTVPSLYHIWTSVDFLEREVFEGFGIFFEGHPDMRPLLLSSPVAELRPLRKDFVVKEEPIFRKRGG